MISSQRLILIFFAMNIMIGIVTHIYNNPTQTTNGYAILTQEQTNVETQINSYGSEETKYGGITNKQYTQETSVGNSISWSGTIWDIFKKAFNPFSLNPDDFDTQIETMFAYMLILLKSMFYVLTIMEVYMMFKNKKSS